MGVKLENPQTTDIALGCPKTTGWGLGAPGDSIIPSVQSQQVCEADSGPGGWEAVCAHWGFPVHEAFSTQTNQASPTLSQPDRAQGQVWEEAGQAGPLPHPPAGLDLKPPRGQGRLVASTLKAPACLSLSGEATQTSGLSGQSLVLTSALGCAGAQDSCCAGWAWPLPPDCRLAGCGALGSPEGAGV